MKIQSERAREIDAYIETHPEAKVANWQIEIAGVKEILPFYKFPLRLLRYNANNGRLAMDKQQWERENERSLDACQPDDAAIIRKLLLDLDPEKTKVLKEDLHKKGQMEPGVISHDGFVINGNRRMAVLEELHSQEPTGKWETLDAMRLPPTISDKDLWKIEAGLQLSKDKIAEYHPVNELLKIKQGLATGLRPKEIAAAMYGRTLEEVEDAMRRLELIESFLEFFGGPGNYGVIKHFGLHEYFKDIQKYVVASAKRRGLSKSQLAKDLHYTFALLRAHILESKRADKKKGGITHWDVRKLGKIFPDPFASDAYLEHLKEAKSLSDVPTDTVIEDFQNAVEVVAMQEQRDQPVRLIEKAIRSLESIDRRSEHFHEGRVTEAIEKLLKLVHEIQQELIEHLSIPDS